MNRVPLSPSAPASAARMDTRVLRRAPASALLRRQCACGNSAADGESCTDCSKKKPSNLQRLADGSGADRNSSRAPPIVAEVLRGSGVPLEPGLLRRMQAGFGHDFSGVRVHADGRAAQSARAVNALAYTVGERIVVDSARGGSSDSRRLMAHELAHVVQNRGQPAVGDSLVVGAADAPEEREADRMAEAALSGGGVVPAMESPPALRRAPGSEGWSGKGINAARSSAGGIVRIPIGGLDVGHQSGTTPSGRAIVLLPQGLDVSKPVDVLLHFHGHNAGYKEVSPGQVRDQQQDRIATQMIAAGRAQMIAVLPQGDAKAAFGLRNGKKAFNSDAYLDAVLDTLENLGVLKPRPSVGRVLLSGHSGAGELLNEKLLGNDPDSSLPGKFGSLAEVALFDAVNGPNEFIALHGFLRAKLAADLQALLSLPDDAARLQFLARSFRFRAHFSSAGTYYSQWHVGPLPKNPKLQKLQPLRTLLTDFFSASAVSLGGAGSAVVKAFEANYRIIDAGPAAVHDRMVGDQDALQDAIKVMPKADGSAALPDTAPASVHQVLRGSGKPLVQDDRDWAEAYFERSFSAVRIHDDVQAAASAEALHAQAYTVGRDIVFGPQRYIAGSGGTRGLLAHELTHVVQQTGARDVRPSLPATLAVGATDDRWEQEARGAEADGSTGAGLRVQRAPKPLPVAVCEARKNPPPVAAGDCSYRDPENCPTYEGWISTFTRLKAFDAKDTPGTAESGFDVLGEGPADVDFRKASTPAKPAAPVITPLKPGERFIDHPTDDWVKNCLPENLRIVAYQLPADCADVAMILRHVWLAAHGRTQKFGKWTLGSAAGSAESKHVNQMIAQEGTWGVKGIVEPYADSNGKPLRSFQALAPLLHPGDVLVWWHYDKGFDKPRTGGHTHTVTAVKRDAAGKLTGMTLLQGNEPLFGRRDPSRPVSPDNPARQKEEIQDFLKKENPKKALPTDDQLGHAPGRRIERTSAQGSGIDVSAASDTVIKEGDKTVSVWQWDIDKQTHKDKGTLLVAAGPPKAAARPAMQPTKSKSTPASRRITDWSSAFGKANAQNFMGVLEAMLYELRATVEGGSAISEVEVRAVAGAAGSRVWALGKAARDLGTTHFRLVEPALAMIADFMRSRDANATGDPKSAHDKLTGVLQQHLRWLRDAFELAARGAADVSFPAAKGKTAAINVLLTGFDPFDPAGTLARPAEGTWNPSGAAVLALDGTSLPITGSAGAKANAAIQGIVLPVSFSRFNDGLVEQALGPQLAQLDALLTVSMDGNLGADKAMRLERYSVGVHKIKGKTEGVAAAGAGSAGRAIIEAPAPLSDIADATAVAPGKRTAGIARPDIGEDVQLRFADAAAADAALKALGLKAQGRALVTITDAAALQRIIATQTRSGSSPQIRFNAGGRSFDATVIAGPGGDFLSNEVAFRAQRLLQGNAATRKTPSFHVHTQGGSVVPQQPGPERKQAQAAAMSLRGTVIDTLKRIVAAVAKIVLDRRSKP